MFMHARPSENTKHNSDRRSGRCAGRSLSVPNYGRFLQPDPIGYEDGMNLYAYAGNDPVNFTDPTGLTSRDPDGDGCTGTRGIDYDVCGRRLNRNGPTGGFGGYGSSMSGFGGGGFDGGGFSGGRNSGERTPPPKEPHDYRFSVTTKCSAPKAFSLIKAPGNSAPGAPQAREGRTNLLLTLGMPITQIVDSDARSLINVTRQGHIFHSGRVSISVRDLGSGYSSINIIGTGLGSYPGANNFIGAAFFGGMAQKVADYCAASSGSQNIKR